MAAVFLPFGRRFPGPPLAPGAGGAEVTGADGLEGGLQGGKIGAGGGDPLPTVLPCTIISKRILLRIDDNIMYMSMYDTNLLIRKANITIILSDSFFKYDIPNQWGKN